MGLLLFGSLLLFRSWQRSLVASLSKLYSTAASVEYAGRVEDRDYRYYGASTTGRSKNGTSGSSPQGESIRLWQDQNFSYLQSASGYVHSYPIQMNQTWPLEVSILGHVRPLTSPGPAPSPPDDDGEFAIRAVYFVNTKVNPNYAGWIRHQLASFGRRPVREIYLVADAASCSNETSLHEAYRWLREARTSDGCTVHLDCHDGPTETYEHHGIQKLWELGQVHHGERDVAVYLHSRGVTHASTWEEYSANDTFSTLTEDVFSQPVMDRTVDAFRLFPSVIMAGWDCSGGTIRFLGISDAHGWCCLVDTHTEPCTCFVVLPSLSSHRRVGMVQLLLRSGQLLEDRRAARPCDTSVVLRRLDIPVGTGSSARRPRCS